MALQSTHKGLATLVGQAEAANALRAAAARPVHAYLFVGPPGTGKIVAARAFAAMLLCAAGGDDGCEICRRVMEGVHPDYIVFQREGAALTIDQAREVTRAAARSSVEGGRKVLVLPDLHLASDAAPALLKTIEEPADHVIFIGLAELVPPALVTVASRCVQVEFHPLREEEVVAALTSEGVASGTAATVAAMAGGSLDRARLLASDPAVHRRLQAWGAVPTRLDGSGATVAALVDELLDLLKQSSGPLMARQEAELAAAAAQSAGYAVSGPAKAAQAVARAVTKDLEERHRREQRRQRTDELRAGLGALARAYGQRAANGSMRVGPAVRAVALVNSLVTDLVFNPGEQLALQALFVRLDRLAQERT